MIVDGEEGGVAVPEVIERREAKLRKTGGSRSVTLPLAWLNDMRITDRVELVFKGNVIEIEAPRAEIDLEDRPEFALFLDYLAKSALAHPERLRNAAEVMAGDEDLFAGVETDDV